MNVQSVINNISFPKTIKELEHFVDEVGHFNVEDVLLSSTVEWTMPKWTLTNDIVFFFHAKTAIQSIRRLESELNRNIGIDNYDMLLQGLRHARDLYSKYGGKIFAIGHVLGRSFYDDGEWQEGVHWRGRVYAEIGDITILQNPVKIDEFSSFISVSRHSAITPVVGTDFEKLKEIIARLNTIPSYLKESHASPLQLSCIDRRNFMKLSQNYRRSFFLEIQFRKFYVDFLLSAIADKKRIFAECACYRAGKLVGYADNGIYFNGKLTFVEVKLNFDAEPKLLEQLSKYTCVDSTTLEKTRSYSGDIEKNYVIAIDTKRIVLFSAKTKELLFITELDQLKNETDLLKLRRSLIKHFETL